MWKISDKNSKSQEYIIHLGSLSLSTESLFFYRMPKGLVISILLLLFLFPVSAQNNNTWTPIGNYTESPDIPPGTGIRNIYIFRDLPGAELSFVTNATIVRFYKYTTSVAEKEPVSPADISSTSSGGTTTYTIANLEDSRAYFAEVDGGQGPVIWIVDYDKHLPQLNGIRVNESGDNCKDLQLVIDKSDELYFYANNGGRHPIVRRYDISYETLEWNAEKREFADKTIEEKGLDIVTDWPVTAPLTDTYFRISGDQFARHFGLDFSASSDLYTAIRTEAHIYAEMTDANGATTSEIENVELSAPVEIFFYGRGNKIPSYETKNQPATYFYVWNIYKEEDQANHIVRYTDTDIKYTFNEAGRYIVRLETSDQNAYCPDSTSMQVTISDYEMVAPGYIILNGTHQFKVKYKSIFNFKCTIFNRWGNKIYEYNDPSLGWDGKHNGRTVSTGVYYYIITFESGDGKKHKASGAINALRPK